MSQSRQALDGFLAGCLLCTTHHRRVHAGELFIEGDAEGQLHFLHHDRAELGGTAGGDPVGSSLREQLESHVGAGRKILAALEGVSGLHPDALCERTGMAYRDVTVALPELRLAGRVRSDPIGLQHLC